MNLFNFKHLLPTLLIIVSFNLQAESDLNFRSSEFTWNGSLAGTVSHVSFKNWTADNNDFTYIIGLNSSIEPSWNDSVWSFDGEWDGRFSIMGGKSIKLKKTEDKLELNLKFGRIFWQSASKTSSLYFVIFADLQSQFFPEFDLYGSPDDKYYISNFMAPGYLTNGISMDYRNDQLGISVSATPLASKQTIVLDRGVDKSYFGIDSNKNVSSSPGAYVRIKINKELFNKTSLTIKTILFKDYSKSTSIDLLVFCEIDYQILSFLKLYTSLNMVNDDNIDVRLYEDLDHDGDSDDFAGVGKRLQLSLQLGIGITVRF